MDSWVRCRRAQRRSRRRLEPWPNGLWSARLRQRYELALQLSPSLPFILAHKFPVRTALADERLAGSHRDFQNRMGMGAENDVDLRAFCRKLLIGFETDVGEG